jgi:xylose isomerase
MSYWHTLTYMGNDPFGGPTMHRDWDNTEDAMKKAKERVHAAFEFMEKMQIPFFCFHDQDIAPRAATLEETNKRLDEIVAVIKEEMARTGIKCLWEPQMHSAMTDSFTGRTSCNATVFAYTQHRSKGYGDHQELGGVNYYSGVDVKVMRPYSIPIPD